MSNDTQCPTCGHFRGFRPGDLGFNPDFETKPARDINVENPQPDPGMLAEYQELFGDDGYLERSMFVDALGGGAPRGVGSRGQRLDGLSVSILVMADRAKRGVTLPSKKLTLTLLHDAYKQSSVSPTRRVG